MKQPLPKAVLIDELQTSRAELESVVAQIPPERMTESGACGSWSVKDVMAHLAVGNDWLALQLERRARGEGPGPEELQRDRELGLDDNETRNAYFAQQHRNLELAYVREWDRRTDERLLAALAALPESLLLKPDWWTGGRALGSVFDLDHNREHARGIKRWLEQC